MFNFLLKKSNQRGIGGAGENEAVYFLQKQGYVIIELNWYNKKGKRLGEIDIIAKENNTIVFVEVKSRTLSEIRDILPEEQVTHAKLKKIQKVSESYIKEKELWNSERRLDIVSVIFIKNSKKIDIKHIKNAFY